ncbi:hypothetical protein GGF31_001977 [Allomyces arbusculus]|nr:hypothetical protein GGF31_001977 [Allomyces arbusculus]
MMAAPASPLPPPADRIHTPFSSSTSDHDDSSSVDGRDRRRYHHNSRRRDHAHRPGASRAARKDSPSLERALGALASNVIGTHLPAIATRAGHDDRAFLSAAQMLLALALEVLERGACPGGDLAVCSLDMLQSGIAAWLADQERARQAYDRMAGKSSRDARPGGAKYFSDPYAVYPTWWGNAEVAPELPPVPPSAQALVQKWNLHGALAESAARAVDALDRPIMPRASAAAWTIPKRMVDEFTQTPIESRIPPAPAVPGVPKHMRTGDAGQPAPAPQQPAAAPAAFFVPVDDTGSAKPRRSPPQLSPPRPRRATAPTPAPVPAKPRPMATTTTTAVARRSTTSSSPGPTARKPVAAAITTKPATSAAAAPKRPKSVAFTVTAPTLPVASSPRVAELVNVARGALAADFCAAFDDGSDTESVSSGDGDKGDGDKGAESRTASPAPSSSPASSTRGMDLRDKPSRTQPATVAEGSRKSGSAESSSPAATAKDRVWFRKAWAARHRDAQAAAQVEVDADAVADAGPGTRAAAPAKAVAWEVPV